MEVKAPSSSHTDLLTNDNKHNQSEKDAVDLAHSPFGSQWKVVDGDAESLARNLLSFIQSDDVIKRLFKEIIGVWQYDCSLHPNVRLMRSRLVLETGELEMVIELHWLDHGERLPPYPLHSEANLEALLLDYQNIGIALDLREDASAYIWAAIVLFCSHPQSFAVPESSRLPLPPDQANPTISYAENNWRSWRIMPSPAGRCVQLPWITTEVLVAGQVVVPINGQGSFVVKDKLTLVEGVKWWLPVSGDQVDREGDVKGVFNILGISGL